MTNNPLPELRESSAVIDAFPRHENGLTPDAVKADPEWQAAKERGAAAFAALRRINAYIVKHYKREERARRAQRGA